eukprot:GHVR01019239.1.p1 GENE.GHVR01019239.1~~GHVR01019239.1.p1  ORF type:complete len:166 (-),score=22.78 GHVR01019239.1:281-778(-)
MSGTIKFDMTSHYTKMSEKQLVDVITHQLIVNNPGCAGFEDIIKEAIKEKKIIKKYETVIVNGTSKNFWSECGKKLKNTSNISLYSNEREIIISFINDNFKEPEDDESLTDPWNVHFDESYDQNVIVIGMSNLYVKKESFLAFFALKDISSNVGGFKAYYTQTKK